MSKFCLISTLIIVSIFVTITIYSDNSPIPGGGNMDGSLDAHVHGDLHKPYAASPLKIHIHSIAYAHVDHHPFGNYTISYKFELTEDGKKKWKGQKIEADKDNDTDEFTQGCVEQFNINKEYASLTNQAPGGATWWDDWLKWSITSTIKSYEFIIVDGKKKKVDKVKYIDSVEMINGKLTPALPDHFTNPPIVVPSPCLSPTNGSYYAYPGETHEATVITSEPYYYVHWYVKAPGDTSSLGTLIETDEGWSTGTETEANFSYTFSTGTVSGEYTITAVSERYSDLSQGSTRSYTVTVF